jgi:hypothetical protein
MLTPEALVDFHVRVVVWPFSMAEGDTLSEMDAAGNTGLFGADGDSGVAGGRTGASFLHPLTDKSKTSRIIVIAAGTHWVFRIGCISFPCLKILKSYRQ